MSDFRMSYRAFNALFSKFAAAVERNAVAKGRDRRMLEGYKLGYIESFFAMELPNLDPEAQVKLFDALEERIIGLNKESMSMELKATKREALIA